MKLSKLLLSGLLFLISVAVSNSQVGQRTDTLLHSWNFSKANWLKNTVSDRSKKIKLEAQFLPTFNSSGQFILSGEQGLFNDSVLPTSLPKNQISAEATVTINEGQQWGSIMGYAQDNGSYER